MTTLVLERPLNQEPVRGERRELLCGYCGYGALVRDEPPDCPMCRSSLWLERERDVHLV